MRPRDEAGPAVMPDHLRAGTRPSGREAAAAWLEERVTWARAHGVSVLDLLREDRAEKARTR